MRDREEFGRGPNEDYLYSLFHVLQQTANEGLASTVQRRLDSGGAAGNPRLIGALLADLRAGRSIDGRLSEGHHGIPHANFSAEAIERALAASGAVAAAPGVGV